MTTMDSSKPIVVAVDGSASALDATRWAAAEAHRRGQHLQVVHSYDWPLPGYGPMYTDPTPLYEAVERSAASLVREAVAVAKVAFPSLAVESTTIRGMTVPALREVSERASLLVLGSRGRGGFIGLLAGSVSVALAAHGHCPVAVIRGAEPKPDAPVVVGVDGSAVSEAAVALAYDEAVTRGCDLVAVHAIADVMFPSGLDDLHPELDWTTPTELANTLLTERLAAWAQKYPQVSVRRVVSSELPSRALLAAAKDAQLVVVGSRGRGGFAGLTLGSVSQAMIHHASCPVLIVRPDAASPA